MSILVSTKYRSDKEEIMDDLDYQGPILHDTLDKLAQINRWLGGNRVTLNGVEKALKEAPKDRLITIVDLGCGSGDILQAIARLGKRKGYQFKLIGIDANPHTVQYARACSSAYENISYEALDIFSEQFKALEYDLVIATLFFHHFKNAALIQFLKPVLKKATYGVVINDLHRHPLAYYLFKALCMTISNQTIVHDGLTSILRGFKKQELIDLSKQIQAEFKLEWFWAFRFQWLLKKTDL